MSDWWSIRGIDQLLFDDLTTPLNLLTTPLFPTHPAIQRPRQAPAILLLHVLIESTQVTQIFKWSPRSIRAPLPVEVLVQERFPPADIQLGPTQGQPRVLWVGRCYICCMSGVDGAGDTKLWDAPTNWFVG
jgi:hypothetical protein